jgi:hypothetical protein
LLRRVGIGSGRRRTVSWWEDECSCTSRTTISQTALPKPWDTWLAMVEDADRSEKNPYLIAWVPDELIHLAQRGIDVNPEECILWLKDCAVAMRTILLEATD